MERGRPNMPRGVGGTWPKNTSALAINYTTQVMDPADGSSATRFHPAQGQWVKFLFYTGGCPATWQRALMCGSKGKKYEADLPPESRKLPIYNYLLHLSIPNSLLPQWPNFPMRIIKLSSYLICQSASLPTIASSSPSPDPSLHHVQRLKFILHAASSRQRCSPVPKPANDGADV